MQLYRKKLGKVAITVEKDPYDSTKDYDKLVIVRDNTSFSTYISRIPVPAGTSLSNKKYWLPIVDGKSIITSCNAYTDSKAISLTIALDENDIVVTFDKQYVIDDINNTQNKSVVALFESNNIYDEVRVYINNVLVETKSNINNFTFNFLYSTTNVDVKFECIIGNTTIIKRYTIPLVHGLWYYADSNDLSSTTTICNSNTICAGSNDKYVSFITKFTTEPKYLYLIIPKSYNPESDFNVLVNGFPINIKMIANTRNYWYVRSDTQLINDVDYHIIVDFINKPKTIF